MTPRRAALVSLVVTLLLGVGAAVDAQTVTFGGALPGSLEEEQAFGEAQERHFIRAREMAEAILRERPDSIGAHFVMGYVHHYGEGNFARALFHHQRAYSLFVEQHGDPPSADAPIDWHFRLLQELAYTHGDLEQYEEQLVWLGRFRDAYRPEFHAQLAWPLMKLRRFDAARRAAEQGVETGDPQQEMIALNALCAVEYEAGDDAAAYDACRAAMDHAGPGRQSVVDYTNFAEAARAIFRLDEAEWADLQATEARVSWYGNPHLELGELYLREGRFPEALEQLQKVPDYRERRPPHVQDADRNESQRALASLFVLLGMPEDALRMSQKALAAPDRRGHVSRDPLQDRALAALLDRAAHRLQAARTLEAAAGGPWYGWFGAYASAWQSRLNAWTSGRTAARHLADHDRLVGTFMIGTHRSSIMPPWLIGDLIDVLGAGVVRQAVNEARAADPREGAGAYYDAVLAEAALATGDLAEASRRAASALADLTPAERLLRARVEALRAEAARRAGRPIEAANGYSQAFQLDPGVLRRLELSVPVRSIQTRGALGSTIAGKLRGSHRFHLAEQGLTLRVEADRGHGEICLTQPDGTVLQCVEEDAEGGDDAGAFAARLVGSFHDQVFAPRVSLSRVDANSLDGSNRVSRDPLGTFFGVEAAER